MSVFLIHDYDANNIAAIPSAGSINAQSSKHIHPNIQTATVLSTPFSGTVIWDIWSIKFTEATRDNINQWLAASKAVTLGF